MAESGEANQPSQKPDEEKLQKSVLAAQKVVQAQEAAASLKDRALNAVNPKERLKLLQQAYDKEVEAWGQSKYAKRLQSGAWQGTVAGGGIGGAVALGLGTVVGTLVSGITAVPTVLVGGLVGAATGSLHGPFLNFGKGDGKKAAMTEDQEKDAAMAEARKLDDAVEKGASTMPQPPRPEDFQDPSEHTADQESETATEAAAKRKPRKLQVRSGNVQPETPSERKKPRKLEMRSKSETVENDG